jgi:hypothetical protein
MTDFPEKQESIRDELGRIKPGHSLNPAGRPKGKTLKEFAREMLMGMNDEDKLAFLKDLPKEIIWRMSEGNPHQTTDHGGEITIVQPLLEAMKPNVRHNLSDKENLLPEETHPSDSGGDVSG